MRSRSVAFASWFLAFMLPTYVQGRGFLYSSQDLIFQILSSALIYEFVVSVWPSLIMHLIAYFSVFKALRGKARSFLAYSTLAYLLIAAGQSTAVIDGRMASILSNSVIIAMVGLLWLRDLLNPVKYEGRGPWWFLPLALLAFIAPFTRTSHASPPWFWMWKGASGQPLLAALALMLDALAGFGTVAFCLFTPLTLAVAGRLGALRPITLRMTSLPGIAFSSIIMIDSALRIASGTSVPEGWFPVAWNAVMHVPLLVICTYYFVARYRATDI